MVSTNKNADHNALECCGNLMSSLETEKRLDFDKPPTKTNPRLSTESLFGEARGQMFGTLLCRPEPGDEKPVVLKAFSGQYNGIWQADGWVPPILSADAFRDIVTPVDQLIKTLSTEINSLPQNSELKSGLLKKRKELSQKLMADIHGLYELHNFKGEKANLFELFSSLPGIPAGTGDCCAPKLLNYAALHNLTPLSLAEFYWGRENRSGTKLHGHFYRPCSSKCGPLLRFMLRGAENLDY